EILGVTTIGSSVTQEIQKNALLSVLAALGGILIYVALRFEFGYGIGAVVATIHDVLMTVGLFVIFGGQFTAPMLAAILMIVGYSINDTIVVFDRIREELGLNPEASLKDIVHASINRVLSRTIWTSLTTLLAAGTLLIFGAGVIQDFAMIFVFGIITGTFSSIFIATPIFFAWHKGDRKHVEAGETPLRRYEWEVSTKESRGEA
ncbi:MAG: protein translocase subunit SecF, partial [Verrucomicrobiota bacterium]